MSEKPYWYPVLCDKEYFDRLREDYPENAHMSDEELHEYYNDGLKYQILWDHIGDAYEDYEPLADEFLRLKAMIPEGADVGALVEKAKAVVDIVKGWDCVVDLRAELDKWR